jgi:hypothetical protein
MSDYLWDRTGEADPEVERLEHLLGTLGHRPGAIELLPLPVPRPVRRHARLFRPAALAAAALALAVLAGTLVLMRDMRDAGRHHEQATTALGGRPSFGPDEQQSPAQAGEQGTTHELSRPAGPGRVIEPAAAGHEAASAAASKLRASVRRPGARERRRRPAATEARGAKGRAGRSEVSRAEAKEQLLYALRLTSMKLEEVRRMTSGREGD